MGKVFISTIKTMGLAIISAVICWVLLPYVTYNEFFSEFSALKFIYYTMPAIFSFSIIFCSYLVKDDHFIWRPILWNISLVFMFSAVLSSWSTHCDSNMDPPIRYILLNHILVFSALYFLYERLADLNFAQLAIFLFSSFLVLLDLHYFFYSLYLVDPFLY